MRSNYKVGIGARSGWLLVLRAVLGWARESLLLRESVVPITSVVGGIGREEGVPIEDCYYTFDGFDEAKARAAAFADEMFSEYLWVIEDEIVSPEMQLGFTPE